MPIISDISDSKLIALILRVGHILTGLHALDDQRIETAQNSSSWFAQGRHGIRDALVRIFPHGLQFQPSRAPGFRPALSLPSTAEDAAAQSFGVEAKRGERSLGLGPS